MSQKFNVELLPDIKFNKNMTTRRIEIAPKNNKNLLKLADIQGFYNNFITVDKIKPRDISIRVQDAFGITLTVKGNRDDKIEFKDDYAVDRVANPSKFDIATKAVFYISI